MKILLPNHIFGMIKSPIPFYRVVHWSLLHQCKALTWFKGCCISLYNVSGNSRDKIGEGQR